MNTVIDTDSAQSLPVSSASNTISDIATTGIAVRQALDLLARASADWRNGGQSPEGPLHWPVAVNLARRELRQVLEIIEAASAAAATPATSATDSEPYAACRTNAGFEGVLDERTAIWRYNSWSWAERAYWHRIAASAVPADAYRAYCEGVYAPDGPQS